MPALKSPIPYFGSKQTLAPWIVSLLPPHEHYVEPYCGSLAVLLAKAPSRMETVNDRDGRLMTFWRVLRDQPDDLARICALTPHSRAQYEADCATLDNPDVPDLERARCVWSVLTQGRARTLDPHGWRYAIGGNRFMPLDMDRAVAGMPSPARRLRRVSLECRPALELINTYGAHQAVLLYVDPPYVGDTRRGADRYGVDMWSEDEHRELAKALWDCSAAVVLSGYPSPLYDELYEGWYREQISTSTGNGRDGERGRAEALWSNRPLGAQGVLDLGAAS